jgi:hypothetical protein
MSTSETISYNIGKCPCGKGNVVRTIVSQDNPWSSADVSNHIECSRCSSEWDLNHSGDRLTLRSSTIPSQLASKIRMEAGHDLDTYIRDLAAKYFEDQKFKTKKAEHEHLIQLGIASGSYRTYLQDRKRSPMHGVGYPRKNEAFVEQVVTTYGDKTQFQALLSAVADADTAYMAASAKIVRHDVKP